MRSIRCGARYVAVGGLMCVLSACGLTAQERSTIQRFARATEAMAVASEDAFVRMREDTVGLSAAVIEFGNPAENPGVTPDDLDRALDPDDLAARLLALRALRDYGALLDALATEGSEARIASAAQSFNGTLGALEERGSIDLSTDQRNALSEMLSRIGQGVVSNKKAQAIREVVPGAAQVLEHLCALIERDFDSTTGGFASQVLVARSDAQAAARLVELGVVEDADVSGERLAGIYLLASAAGDHADAMEPLIKEAASALVDANSNLNTSVMSGGAFSIDRLEHFLLSVRELVTLAEIVGGAPAGALLDSGSE